jgi:hypothetical protein
MAQVAVPFLCPWSVPDSVVNIKFAVKQISCFESGPQEPYRDICLTPCRGQLQNATMHDMILYYHTVCSARGSGHPD